VRAPEQYLMLEFGLNQKSGVKWGRNGVPTPIFAALHP